MQWGRIVALELKSRISLCEHFQSFQPSSYHFQPLLLFIRTVQRSCSCNCSTFLMLRLMSFFSDQHQFSDIRQNYKPWDGKQFCSLFLSVLLHLLRTLSLSYKHTLTQSHTRTHNNSLSTVCGVTNFSWALDFGMREVEKEKMKERREAAVHW